MENLRHICIFLCMILTFTLNGCSIKKEPISKSSFFMGTIVNITLYDKFDEGIIDKAFNKISEIESLLSLNIQNSEINKINEKSGIEPVKVTKTTFDIIEKSLEYSKASKGNFDITIGPLVKLWGIGSEDARVPDDNEILDTIKLINYENIILDKENTTVFLKEENMVLDLGAIAKGYIADLISDILIDEGVSKAIIDENYKLLIVGGLRDEGLKLKAYTESLPIKDKVIFTGFIEDEYLPTLYNATTLFVYPSLYEGFGLPPLEAMSCKTAVLTSNITSIPEVVPFKESLVDPNNPKELSSKLENLLNDSKLRNNLEDICFERSKEFTWEKTAKKTLEVYKKVIEISKNSLIKA